jgi:hypothetical protein
MRFLKKFLNSVHNASIEAKNRRIDECGSDPYDKKTITGELKTSHDKDFYDAISQNTISSSLIMPSSSLLLKDLIDINEHATFDNMIKVIRSLKDEKIKKPEKIYNEWNEFEFEEYQLSECWPSSNLNDRPENLFICKKCPHMFLAYGSMSIEFDVYAIIKHVMKAHFEAHENCPSSSNLKESKN